MFETVSTYFNLPWVYYTFICIYAATTITIIGVILSENRNPVKSLAWVTVLFLLPIVGIILYLFFGRSIKNQRMISRRNRRRLRKYERAPNIDKHSLGLSEESLQMINLAGTLASSPYYPDNSVEIFTDGTSKFEAFKKDLRNARHSINLQYYIFEDDNIGREIRDILIERHNSGVEVRVIYDHVGSFKVKSSFFKKMRRSGIQAYPFLKVSFPQFGTRINWRNHRKICIIDGSIGYIGGMNIADRYLDGGKKFDLWRDTHLRLTGPVVRALRYSFAIDWNFMGQPLLENDIDLVSYPATDAPRAGMQLLTSGPTSQWSNIAFMFHKAIAGAKRRVYLQTPYFLPTEGLLKALQVAALAHVDVRVIIPRHSDSKMLTYASYSYIAESLKSGIKIYFYEPGMLHAKTLIIDDEFTSVGSTNFDFRSFECNFESNIFIYSKEVNAQMSDIFNKDLGHSTRIIPFEWRNRPYRQKAVESLVRLLSPIL
ncbi:cardiolipin synthase [uncultured Muribaculum sp.]|uniref:cardiolipin synthase n=1 Tax=uncultured Muribaculum sp. TaxID=1918613 RepID=UPI00272959F2|nr:cardiolipin synthase [uncultured Muribaculum sp.]